MSLILSALSKKPFAVIGHRGAAGLAMENTLTAIEKALELKVEIIEVDLHKTKDNVLVLFHDDDLKRIAGRDDKISDITYGVLKKIDLNGDYVPTLEEAIELIDGKAGLYVDVKDPAAARDALKLIERKVAVDWVAFISSYDDVLTSVRELNKNVVTGLIYFKPPGRIFDAKKLGAKIVLPRWNIATEKANLTAHKLKLKVSTWTVNDISLAVKVVKRGVDGVASDFPDKLKRLQREFKF